MTWNKESVKEAEDGWTNGAGITVAVGTGAAKKRCTEGGQGGEESTR
jgi:hypothetical protein